MSRHARIEEVDDDPEESDISTLVVSPSKSEHILSPSDLPSPAGTSPQYIPASATSQFKSYQCLYPVYFDILRTRAEGRKVSKACAVANPLARELVDACTSLGIKTVFEPGKTHPKDWANPGRVRVLLKQDGKAVHEKLTNKFLLLQAVGEYLKEHPTTKETPLKLRIPGVPFDGKPPAPPVVPRGWKMGEVLPLHSPALSGGGVSEDFFKEMMQGMGMGEMGGPSSGGPPQIEGKKEKKKKGKR